MLPRGARSFEVAVNLAVGREARCWRSEVYAEDRAHPLLPLGRLPNVLDAKFVWENGQAAMQCRDKGNWKTMMQFEVRSMAYASQMQFEVLRHALWAQQLSSTEHRVRLEVLGEGCSRPKDVCISTSWCEGEDVWNHSACEHCGRPVHCSTRWRLSWLVSQPRQEVQELNPYVIVECYLEVDKVSKLMPIFVSKLMPIFVPMPKKDAASRSSRNQESTRTA